MMNTEHYLSEWMSECFKDSISEELFSFEDLVFSQGNLENIKTWRRLLDSDFIQPTSKITMKEYINFVNLVTDFKASLRQEDLAA